MSEICRNDKFQDCDLLRCKNSGTLLEYRDLKALRPHCVIRETKNTVNLNSDCSPVVLCTLNSVPSQYLQLFYCKNIKNISINQKYSDSPLTKDLTEGDGEKETACGQWRSRDRPNGVTSLCSAPQTPAASGCKTPPARATWRPQSLRSRRRTQDFRPRPTSRGRASLSIGRRRR